MRDIGPVVAAVRNGEDRDELHVWLGEAAATHGQRAAAAAVTLRVTLGPWLLCFPKRNER